MAVFLIRGVMGDTFSSNTTPYFADVAASQPFFRYIQKMKEWGITSGCTAERYCADNPASRGEMAVFVVRAFFTPR